MRDNLSLLLQDVISQGRTAVKGMLEELPSEAFQFICSFVSFKDWLHLVVCSTVLRAKVSNCSLVRLPLSPLSPLSSLSLSLSLVAHVYVYHTLTMVVFQLIYFLARFSCIRVWTFAKNENLTTFHSSKHLGVSIFLS
jgi:hypothetical protein